MEKSNYSLYDSSFAENLSTIGYFREAGIEIHAAIETNSLITLWSHLKFGQWSSVVPKSFLSLIGDVDGLISLALVEPDATHAVGLVASERDPLPPVVRAFLDAAKQIDFGKEAESQVDHPAK